MTSLPFGVPLVSSSVSASTASVSGTVRAIFAASLPCWAAPAIPFMWAGDGVPWAMWWRGEVKMAASLAGGKSTNTTFPPRLSMALD
jgi:hypothetical protein